MNKKLLQKTSKAYLIYAVLILIFSAPVFYYATKKIYIKEADDTLRLHKNEFLQYTAFTLQKKDIAVWNSFNRNTKIESGYYVTKDSLFFANYYDTLDEEIEPYRVLNCPVVIQNSPYIYIERVNLVETADLIKNIAVLFSAIISILLVGLFIITKKLSVNLWRPFYETLNQIENFEIDKTRTPTFANTGIEEFNRLNTSIEKLIERNKLIYKSQKEFIENAAHELQTPLAVFQAKIDTIIQRDDITEEQAILLGSLNDNVARLNRLNKNLLFLSKIEHNNYSSKETISIGKYIKKNLAFFTEQSKAKNINIKVELLQELPIQSNPVLAEILISNLFLNAVRHNIQDGQITITIKENKLIFENNGRKQPLDVKKLFNRFSKTNPTEQGTGLGLSIIKKVADNNKWTVLYSYDDGLHSFSIIF